MKRYRWIAVVALAVAAFVCVGTAGAGGNAQSPVNGGFEAGKFGPWRNMQSGGGFWTVFEGTDSPFGIPPYEGDFGAVALQFEPNWQTMSQSLHLQRGRTTLTFALLYGEEFFCCGTPKPQGFPTESPTPRCAPVAGSLVPSCGIDGVFCPVATLDLGRCNQQIRVDVLKGKSDPRTFRAKDVLQTLFVTQDGYPAFLFDYVPLSFDLSALVGRDVTLRFLVTATEFPLLTFVDGVTLSSDIP